MYMNSTCSAFKNGVLRFRPEEQNEIFKAIKQLKITSNIEDNMDLHHRVRIMTFKTQDLDDLVGCG